MHVYLVLFFFFAGIVLSLPPPKPAVAPQKDLSLLSPRRSPVSSEEEEVKADRDDTLIISCTETGPGAEAFPVIDHRRIGLLTDGVNAQTALIERTLVQVSLPFFFSLFTSVFCYLL
jgi:hypothetical protein